MRVHVAYVGPGLELCVAVDVDERATVDDAVRASRIAERVAIFAEPDAYAVFGKRVAPDTLLAEGDRVEITRPLLREPKAARRRRAAIASGEHASKRERSTATQPADVLPAAAAKVEADPKP